MQVGCPSQCALSNTDSLIHWEHGILEMMKRNSDVYSIAYARFWKLTACQEVSELKVCTSNTCLTSVSLVLGWYYDWRQWEDGKGKREVMQTMGPVLRRGGGN